jgi:hypothetical protein
MRNLIALAVAGVVATSLHAAVDADSVVGMWLFDGGSGETGADASGNGNEAALVGATWGDGVRGSAVEFDGASHVAIPANAMTDDYLDGFTYMLWVDVVSTPNANSRIMERDWHNPAIQAGGGDFYGSIVTEDNNIDNGIRGGAYAAGEFAHVALTHDGATLTLYVGGEAVNESSVGAPTFTNAAGGGAIYLGQWKDPGWDLTGRIDEVAVFSAALAQADIQSLMNDGLESLTAVEARGKLALSWGDIKTAAR